MRTFLESIQYSAFGLWVAGGDTIFAYPTILALHTLGLGIVVGMSAIINCHVLFGMGRGVALGNFAWLFRILWIGLALNGTTGVILFIAAAADKAYQEIFYLKLVFIALALVAVIRIRRSIFLAPAAIEGTMPRHARVLAALSLVLWMGAIVAGRLMAYTTTF